MRDGMAQNLKLKIYSSLLKLNCIDNEPVTLKIIKLE